MSCLPLDSQEDALHNLYLNTFTVAHVNLEGIHHILFLFRLQYGPPGMYQPGEITERTVLNMYGGFSASRITGFMLDRYKVRNLMFYYAF